MIRWHATNVAAFAGNQGQVRLNEFGYQISVNSAAAVSVKVRMPMMGYFQQSIRSYRSIILFLLGA